MIAFACLLVAGAMVVAAAAVSMGVMHVTAPPRRLEFLGSWITPIAVVLLAGGAALVGAAGYDLLRLRAWSRRAVLVLLVLYALGRLPAVLRAVSSGRFADGGMDLAILIASVAGAVYLSRSSVKGVFNGNA